MNEGDVQIGNTQELKFDQLKHSGIHVGVPMRVDGWFLGRDSATCCGAYRKKVAELQYLLG